MVDDESSETRARENASPGAREQEHRFTELRHYVPAELLNVSFPASVRGYDRRAVDAYVKRVNRVIAELKVSASPPAAVRHALEQAGQQVHGLLQSARETAEGITASARQEAEESTARASAEAAELVVNASADADRVRAEADELIANARAEAVATVGNARTEAGQIVADARAEAQDILARTRAEADERLQQLHEELAALRDQAETRMREIRADTDAVWDERHELLDDIRRMAGGLVDLADGAAARFARREQAEPEDDIPGAEAETEAEAPRVATNEATRSMPAVGTEVRGDDVPGEEVTARTTRVEPARPER